MLRPSPPEVVGVSAAGPAGGAAAERRLAAWLAEDRAQRTIATPAGDVTTVSERGGGRSEYRYDGRGDLAHVLEPGGGRVDFEYDDRRRLEAVVRRGARTEFAYDDRDRLVAAAGDGLGGVRRYHRDAGGRLAVVRHGDGTTAAFAYDPAGRLREGRTPTVSTVHDYDDAGRLTRIRQTLDGVTLELRLEFDPDGRLAALRLPGGRVRYGWDDRGRPAWVGFGEAAAAGAVGAVAASAPLARFAYDDARRETGVTYSSGLVERTRADPVDGRLLERELRRGEEVLLGRRHAHDPAGRIVADGARRYGYDDLGRLTRVEDDRTGEVWGYGYDARDNRVESGPRAYEHVEDDLVGIRGDGADTRFASDAAGRRTGAAGRGGTHAYRYDAAGDLREVLRDGALVARLTYDHKGRLAAVCRAAPPGGPGGAGRVSERYLYGPDDELVAVADATGRPLRAIVRTPLGPVAEIRDPGGSGEAVTFLHLDHQGTCHLATDETGAPAGEWRFCPFGTPSGSGRVGPRFAGREWHADLGLYRFGARWYDPATGRFLTPDSFTGAPDDERLVNPLVPGSAQPLARAELLAGWLQRPRIRNRFAFCANDPVNRIDPNGHWSFGAALMTLLGAVWALPNTIFGLLLEITCLIGEVVRWVVSAVSGGETDWESPGFGVAASKRLNAFGLVFSGGWLGSFASVPALTFGNVFFVYRKWETLPEFSAPGEVRPAAYAGKVSIPRHDTLFEHELFHTKQYGQLGPFFHLGLPLFGVYEWDLLLGGRAGSVLEQQARDHSGRPAPAAAAGG